MSQDISPNQAYNKVRFKYATCLVSQLSSTLMMIFTFRCIFLIEIFIYIRNEYIKFAMTYHDELLIGAKVLLIILYQNILPIHFLQLQAIQIDNEIDIHEDLSWDL